MEPVSRGQDHCLHQETDVVARDHNQMRQPGDSKGILEVAGERVPKPKHDAAQQSGLGLGKQRCDDTLEMCFAAIECS